MLVRELLFLSQLTTTSIYTEKSSERKKNMICKHFRGNKLVLSLLRTLIFASCYVRDTLIVRVTLISRFFKVAS